MLPLEGWEYMVNRQPQSLKDPQLVKMVKCIEQRGHGANIRISWPVCSMSLGPSIYFSAGAKDDPGRGQSNAKNGKIFFYNEKWRVYLAEEKQIIDCAGINETLNCVFEYLESPAWDSRLGFQEYDAQLVKIKEDIEQEGYKARLQIMELGPTVVFEGKRGEYTDKNGRKKTPPGQSGRIFYFNEQWRVYFSDEKKTFDFVSSTALMECVLEYIAKPCWITRFGLTENDPRFTYIKECIEIRGYWAELSANYFVVGQSVAFASSKRIDEKGFIRWSVKKGIIQCWRAKWQVSFSEGEEVEYAGIDELLAGIFDYLTSPTLKERFALREDDPRFSYISERIRQHGYWARTGMDIWPMVYCASSSPSTDEGDLLECSEIQLFFSYTDQQWHVYLLHDESEIAFSDVDEMITYIVEYLETSAIDNRSLD